MCVERDTSVGSHYHRKVSSGHLEFIVTHTNNHKEVYRGQYVVKGVKADRSLLTHSYMPYWHVCTVSPEPD